MTNDKRMTNGIWMSPQQFYSKIIQPTIKQTVIRHLSFVISHLLLLSLLAGCSAHSRQTPEQRAEAAKALFEQTTKNYHTPSATATDSEKARLQKQAAAGYEQLLKKYPEQEYWAAQAMRNLAGTKAAQGKADEAVKLYGALETKYPKQAWEVLMAWKSAADLLWEHGEQGPAKVYYKKIVDKYDNPETAQVIQIIVRGSLRRLGGGDLP